MSYSERASTLVDLNRDGNPDHVAVDGSALVPQFAYSYGDGTGRFGRGSSCPRRSSPRR